MSDKNKANLLAVLDAVNKIQSFTSNLDSASSFYTDTKTFDATLMNFIVIGESVKRLSSSLKENNQQIAWTKIADFRNIVAHDYFGVDADEIWEIIQKSIPKLKSDIEQILSL